jgi:hypothetical protein
MGKTPAKLLTWARFFLAGYRYLGKDYHYK